jgi:hypothetical protein
LISFFKTFTIHRKGTFVALNNSSHTILIEAKTAARLSIISTVKKTSTLSVPIKNEEHGPVA